MPYGKKVDTSLINYIQEKLNNHWSLKQISGGIIIDIPNKKLNLVVSIISYITEY